MKSFDSLVQLVKKLNSEEIKSLQKFLNYYNGRNPKSKSEELINIILKEKNYNIKGIQNKLYNEVNNFAFNKLIDRLRDKILEVIIFDSNVSRNYYPERVKVIFELKKKLIQSDILNQKGLREDADDVCKRIIKKAEKYELFDIIVSALQIRQRFVNIRKNQKEVSLIQREINLAEEKNKAITITQNVFDTIINKINVSSESKVYHDDLLKSIKNIETIYNEFKLPIIGYNLFFLKTELSQNMEDYHGASVHLMEIKNLLVNKALYTEYRMGTTLLNIASNNVHLGKFDESIELATEAKKKFPNNIYNKALVDECLFFAYLYKNDISTSESLMDKMINLPRQNLIEFSVNKWNYFSACISFQKGEYQKCIDKLMDVKEINKDKEGWNINRRILLILCRIELGQLESVDLQVSNLEKFVKRLINKREVRLRYIYILRILIKLMNSNLNYISVYKTRIRYFNSLESTDPNLKWKIKSPELINFNKWIDSKIHLKEGEYKLTSPRFQI